jgi:hypothetical protein
MKWRPNIGWEVQGQRTGPWGHLYAEMPIALVAELNGLRRREVLEEIDRRLKKVDRSKIASLRRASGKIELILLPNPKKRK